MASMNRGDRYDDDDDFGRPSGGVGPSSIAYESPRRRTGRRRFLTLLVVALAIGGFVGIVWHAYNQGKSSGGEAVVPLLKAEDGPIRTRPDQPGGLDVPNQDKLIYDRLARGPQQGAAPQIERLLPPPETPMARPAPPPPPADIAPGYGNPVVAPAAELQPPPLAPRVVETPAPPQPLPAAPPARPAGPQTPAPSANPAASATGQAAALAAAGGARIQLGAMRSTDAAQKEWARLQTANRDLLGGLTMNVVAADLGDRGMFYRIQAGPVGDAADLCAKLKARNVGCLVVR